MRLIKDLSSSRIPQIGLAAAVLLPMGLLSLLPLLPEVAQAQAVASDERELRVITQQLLDAAGSGKKGAWQRYGAANLVQIDETGTVRSKAQVLAELSPLPAGLSGSLKIDRFSVTRQGPIITAIHEDQENLNYHGQMLHSRFRTVDVWQRLAGNWELLTEQVSPILKDPPVMPHISVDLCQYAGTYALADDVSMTLSCVDGGLTARRNGRPDARYLPEAPDVFFQPGQPRSRRIFVRGPDGRIGGFVDRREGEDIIWQRKSN